MDLFSAQHGALPFIINVDHLLEAAPRAIIDHVVRQDDGERLVAHHASGAIDRVPQSQRLGLANIDTGDATGNDVLQRLEGFGLAAGGQFGFQLVGLVEMVLDGPLGAAGHEYQGIHARRNRFLDSILNQWLVDDRQHLLGTRLGGGKKPGSQPGDRKDSFLNHFFHEATSVGCW